MKHNKNCQGFTLIELAVVLVVVGLLLGGFVGSLSSRIEATRYAETRENLENIKQALIGYTYTNGFLPCPDTDGDGRSDMPCMAGSVPWVTLGLRSGDAWNNRFEYWLDVVNFSVPFDLDTTAIGEVRTRSVDGATLESYAENVVAVIFSRGNNGLGAVGVNGSARAAIPSTGHSDEVENGDGDNTFVSRTHTVMDATTNVGIFDDQLLWISEFSIKAKMVEAGKLP